MAPKKAPAPPNDEPVVTVSVEVLSRLDHDGQSYDEGEGLEMDLTTANGLREAGVVDYLDPPAT